MALRSPDPGQFIQNVIVNGYGYYPAYASLGRQITVGSHVDLVAEPSNPHDGNAVKVCFMGAQIGWVPKTVNKEIARRLKAGEKLRAEVGYHKQHDLRLGVYAEPRVGTSGNEARPLATVEITGRPSQAPSAFEGIGRHIPGTCFPLASAANRVSISLSDPHDGHDLAWFRKSSLPERCADAVAQLADRGQLVAVKRGDGMFDLYQKGREPKAPMSSLRVGSLVLPADGTLTGSLQIQSVNPTTKKENTMNFAQTTTSLINNNKSAATQAGYLEAGRIANNQFTKLAAKSLPMMLRGYADTAVGKLVIANIAQMAAAQLRPQDATLAKLTSAMTVAAYQGVIQTVDIEGWLNELLGSPEIKRAMDKLNVSDSGSVAAGAFSGSMAAEQNA